VPLPFDLPAVSRGFAELTPSACSVGARAAESAARVLGELLGREVSIRARPSPGAPAPRAAVARVALDLTALPGAAVLELDAALVVGLVDALAGGSGTSSGATALTPVEAAALELLALAALDGACSVAFVEDALAPRLSRGASEPRSALAVELDVSAGPLAGKGRLLLPVAAVRALRDPSAPFGPAAATPLPVSVRSGRAPLEPEELAALAAGDVVVLDAPADAADALVLPGGARFAGRLEDGTFHVEELAMTEHGTQRMVTLEIELARIDVPLAEIARLEPGAALPLAIDRRGLVTLRVGERAVARGELVDVDGAVGVRVLSLEEAP